MSFYAKNFIYNGQSSELYGLICASTQAVGEILSSAGSNIAIQEEYVLRRETPYFYGVSFPDKLQFDVEFYSEDPIPRQKVSEIERWLFGLSSYKKFEIVQEDMEGIYFNCLFVNAIISTIGNLVVGFHATCVCDAPWAWGKEVTHRKENITSTMIVNNTSDNTRYTKPFITITFNSNYDEVYIENENMNSANWSTFTSNAMLFEDVVAGEVIEINTDLRLITSTRPDIVNRFNGKYMYLLQGINTIHVSNSISEIVIKYTPARKVGS